MILRNPKYKKHAEAIIEYCKANGMEPISTMGLWNHLVKIYKRIEKSEDRQNLKRTTNQSAVHGQGRSRNPNGFAHLASRWAKF